MNFNHFIWGLYKNSPEGNAAIARNISEYVPLDAFDIDIMLYEAVNGEILENGECVSATVNLQELVAEYASEFRPENLEAAEKIFTEIVNEGVLREFEFDGIEKIFLGELGGDEIEVLVNIEAVSAGLADACPEFFIPYLFACKFDLLEKICKTFDIALPEIPSKREKRECALYYLKINRAFQSFRLKHELSPQDLKAFLYDFAEKNLPNISEKNLPSPSRVWFVIGGTGKGHADFNALDEADEHTVYRWQGSLETRRGDIVLMYCASPRSYLHSVWRAVDDGFIDPFFYYYSSTRVSHPIKISPIRFSEFSKHPFLGKKPIVKGCFQGASGTAFSIEDYAAICDILQQKGFDISRLPQAPEIKEFLIKGIENESDVERALLEPFLLRLGYSPDDWVRQLPVRMGRKERNYPDYVLGCNPLPKEESAIAVIECKLNINTDKERKEAFVQAKSYALRLEALVLVLAAQRGVWLFSKREEGFSGDQFTFKTWEELSHPDILHSVSLKLGKLAIEKLQKQRKVKAVHVKTESKNGITRLNQKN